MKPAKVITIFGSSRAKKDTRLYEEAYRLGKLLAESGFIVCNGGYGGTMAASARGAKDAGGNTIGITTKVFGDAILNAWIDKEIPTESYKERLMALVSVADAFIVLEGGIGTLSEATFVWTLAAVGELQKPIVLVGHAWRKSINSLSKSLLISRKDIQALNIVETPEEAVKLINEFWSDK